MQIDDSANPAPPLVSWGTVAPGAPVRIGDDYVIKCADGATGVILATGAMIDPTNETVVDPVNAVVKILAP